MASSNIPKLILDTYRQFGIAAARRDLIERLRSKVWGKREYRLMTVDAAQWKIANVNEKFKISLGQPSALIPYVADPALELDPQFLLRLPSEVTVAVAKFEGSAELAGYGFISQQPIAIDGDLFFVPPLLTAYLFKFFVVPKARRGGLLHSMIGELIASRQNQSLKKYYAIILGSNFVSLKAFGALGFERLKSFLVGPKSRGEIYPD